MSASLEDIQRGGLSIHRDTLDTSIVFVEYKNQNWILCILPDKVIKYVPVRVI